MPESASVENAFQSWCIVEVLGHKRLAGFCTEQVIAGHGFLRVDVPATSDNPAFTQLFAPASIYAITPTHEQDARAAAERFAYRPVELWIYRKPVEQIGLYGDDPDEHDDAADWH